MFGPSRPRLAVGIVGAGAVGRRHAATLATFPDVRIAAVGDVDLLAARSMARDCGCPAYPDARAMLESGRLDAVYVCVPPFAHGPAEQAALGAGLPLFVEKPVAIDLATAETVAAAAERCGAPTAVGYHWRGLDTVAHVGRLLADRPPQLVIGSWLDKVPPPRWWTRRDRSGGQVVEQGTHLLDLLRFLAGEVSDVHARAVRGPRADHPDSDVADATCVVGTLAAGGVVTFAFTCLLQGQYRAGLELFAEGLAIELSEASLVVRQGDRAFRRPVADNAKAKADRDFIDAAAGRPDRILCPYRDAVKTQRLALAITDAIEVRDPA